MSRYNDLVNDPLVRGMIKQVEGFRSLPYDDQTGLPLVCPKGKITIWWGLNLSDLDPADSIELAEHALTLKLQRMISGLKIVIPCFENISSDEQLALINLAYNVGIGGVASFHKMCKAIISRDRKAASIEVLDSSVYKTAMEKNLTGLVKRYLEISRLLKGTDQ